MSETDVLRKMQKLAKKGKLDELMRLRETLDAAIDMKTEQAERDRDPDYDWEEASRVSALTLESGSEDDFVEQDTATQPDKDWDGALGEIYKE